jgi:hypothetical protein
MKQIGVDFRFLIDGIMIVKRIQLDDQWLQIEQGRQWIDNSGRHVLVRLLDGKTGEILLDPETMIWQFKTKYGGQIEIV